MNSLQTLGIAAVIFITGFSSGFLVNSWKRDAEKLAEQTAAQEAYIIASARQNEISANLQKSLDELDKKKLTSHKETFHETTKIEYRCILPESGRLLYNTAAAESAAASKP